MITINTTQYEFMIYRNNKLDRNYALRQILRHFSRVLWLQTRKVLAGILDGVELLVREFNKK